MKPIRFEQANKTLAKPPSMTDEECAPLHIHDTGQAMISCWQLSADDLAEIQRTGCLWLWVFGRGHPPVAIDVVTPFPETR